MKKLVFITIAVCTVMLFSFKSSDDDRLPAYSLELFNSIEDCSCTGMFSSCSSSGDCTCSCGYFSCSCTSKTKDLSPEFTGIDISISPDQYQNIEMLWEKLGNIDAKQAKKNLVMLIQSLKDNDIMSFHNNRKAYFQSLDNLNLKQKNELNLFFKSIGAEERV